jgi:hypothetical protein
MKKNLAIIAFILLVGVSVAVPMVSFAAANGSWTAPNLFGNPPGFWGPIVWCTGNYLANPQYVGNTHPATCNNLCDLIETVINVVYLLMSIAIFVIAPILVVWGGIMIMFAGANPGTLETGKKILLGLVIGIAITLLAYLLINTVLSVLNITSIGGFNGGPSTCSVQ